MQREDSEAPEQEASAVEPAEPHALPGSEAARERLRLRQLLHDDIQQRLYSLRIQLIDVRDGMLRAQPTSRAMVEALETADATLLGTIRALRRLTEDLASPDENMQEALASVAAHMRALHGLTVDVVCDLGGSEPCRSVRATLVRVIRELLFNVVKHSGVAIARVAAENDGGVLHVEVRDEGRGFSAPSGPLPRPEEGSFGLRDALASLQVLGGQLTVATSPGAGTAIRMSVPLQARSRPA